jgi:acylpyruvate hydrolase
MRLVTFEPAPGCDRLGALVDETVVDLALAGNVMAASTASEIYPLPSDMVSFLNQGDIAMETAEKVIQWARGLLKTSGKVEMGPGQTISYGLDAVRLRAPVLFPPKILCLALNYRAHADEGDIVVPDRPYVFIKPGFRPVVGPNETVYRPPKSKNLIFEGELAVVIGKRCRGVSKDKAYDVIAGYTAINDMSARDLGKTNIPGLFDWFQVKAFDTSLPMGPCLTFKDEIEDPHRLRLTVRLNGNVVQDASTEEMVYKIPEVIEFISEYITLDPGDIIATGTPGGSKGALKAGDIVEVEIHNIGTLLSVVADRKTA